ncbi:MAG: cupin domain-containing protein [Proteobacteria bacterium]|nr:cupin domain-containing protein [Pseudomonadota bacterium]
MKREGMHDACEMLLMDYCCGVLDEAQELLVSAYLSVSLPARRQMFLLETIGGVLMEKDCAPVLMNEDSLSSVLDRVDGCSGETQGESGTPGFPLPRSLRQYIAGQDGHAGEGRWRWAGFRVRVVRVHVSRSSYKTLLVRMAPGARIARHRHAGMEYTLVLEGALRDENEVYEAGDLLVMDAGTEHSLQSDARKGCVCLTVSGSWPLSPSLLDRLMAGF